MTASASCRWLTQHRLATFLSQPPATQTSSTNDILSCSKMAASLATLAISTSKSKMNELKAYAKSSREARKNIIEYTLPSGKKVNVLGEGRLVNLACADGHPAEIMDLSFSLQLLCLLWGLENGKKLEKNRQQSPGRGRPPCCHAQACLRWG